MPGDDGGIAIPLELFSSLDTEIFPPPEGISPDNADVIYKPQTVQSREGLHKILSAAIPGNPAIVGIKTYTPNNYSALTLVLDAKGNLWREDVLVSPGILSFVQNIFGQLVNRIGRPVMRSATWLGKEFFACSDGFTPTAPPVQYDAAMQPGFNMDRITQDGPGAAPSAADEAVSSTISAAGIPGLSIQFSVHPIANISEVGLLVTVQLVTAFSGQFNPQVGDNLEIAGGGNPYNGNFTITAVNGTQIQYINNTPGLAPFIGGTAAIYVIQVKTTTAHGLTVGQNTTIAGAGVAGYNGTYQVRSVASTTQFAVPASVTQEILANSGGGTANAAGSLSAGVHQVVVLFKTRTGYITAPSPKFSWTSAGAVRVVVTNIPLGPPNVIARILAFTGSGGANFFYIPVPITIQGPAGTPPTIIQSTVVNDNTSTTATIDFADTTLFSATAIDIPGRNYFANVTLAPCLGVFPYASRLFAYGEFNKLQNLVNMGFEGGYLPSTFPQPLGWTTDGHGSVAVAADPYPAQYFIIGFGLGPRGVISQSFYQDVNGVAIGTPLQSYTLVAYLRQTGETTTSTFVCEIFSPSAGVLASGSIFINSLSTVGGFNIIPMTGTMPSVIPSDAILRLYANNLSNGIILYVDELMIVPSGFPVRRAVMRGSYINSFQFDGVTGDIGPANDTSGILSLAEIRGTLYIDTANGKHSTSDNATGEPSSWGVNEITQSAGVLSIMASDPGSLGSGDSGEQWEFFVGYGGLYIYSGGETLKISQEVQGIWDRINLTYRTIIWLKNDYVGRRCYIGLPLDSSTTINKILVLDYNNLNDAGAIANTGPIHESLSGKLNCREFSRKWSLWNIAVNCCEVIVRPNANIELCLGGNSGNFYYLDPTKLTDDDYGVIAGYYTTYPFGTSDQEQQFGLSRHKLATYLSSNLLGTGLASIIPYSNVLANQYPEFPRYPLSETQNHDLEWDMNVDGERIGLRIGSVPANGSFPVTLVTITQNAPTTATFAMQNPGVVTVGQSFPYVGTNPALTGTWTVTVVNSPTSFVATSVVSGSAGDFSTLGAITVTGLTDNRFILQGLSMGLKSNPWSPVRGSF